MKVTKLLLVGCASLGLAIVGNAQIQNATAPDMGIAPAPVNTGIAIAPAVDVQATVFDDGTGGYKIFWIESATSTIVDAHGNTGNDPDVAYYANADALVVAYENGGVIFVDDYYLMTLFPAPDYFLGGTTNVAVGSYPNVDMNSLGDGVLCWEDGGMVWVCSFNIGGFVAGPPVPINPGTQPDVVLLDDGITLALTYVDPGGVLIIETMDYAGITGGAYVPWNQWQYPPMIQYEYPRIAGQRNTNFGFGAPDDFTVVAQDHNGGTAEVHAFFAMGGAIVTPMVLVNNDFMGCSTFDPRPVVTYERGRVHIAWSQDYMGGCSGLWQTAPNPEDDVLMKMYNAAGATGGMYEEVNTFQSAFASNSRTSISAEYDGNYMITNANWHEGIVYNDPGDLLWKGRSNVTPGWLDQADPTHTREDNFSLANSPVDHTIEVISEDDAPATFTLMDNAGRTVELKTITNNGNNYSIDISHLSGGMYFLHCSSEASEEVLRVLQVRK